MPKYAINPFTGNLDVTVDNVALTQNITEAAQGGYEFTAGFTDRSTGNGGASDIGTNTEYTSVMAANDRWLRFGFSDARQIANDTPYWGDGPDADEAPHSGTTDYQGVGLFSGAYMPAGITNMFNFTENGTYNQAQESGDMQYTAANGSLDFTQCQVGDLASVRFDFNIVPQFPNTTVEVALIWATRDANDDITFTFPLTTQPIFVTAGAGEVFLCRPLITAYFASQEDVNARALPAIRSNQPVFIQPLTCLSTIRR